MAYRATEVYAAACVSCGCEIESLTYVIPLLCTKCIEKKQKQLEANCSYNHDYLNKSSNHTKCPGCGKVFNKEIK